jgi:meso-butanediol dehydrogenase / (S,S)-butanediol dehydrogenase / diacetyl reductase
MAAALPGGREMPDSFSTRKVLITGSTRGLGRAAALKFLDRGAEVTIHGSNQTLLEAVISDLSVGYRQQVRGCVADLADRKAQDRLADFAGDLDVLVNCAGVYEEVKLSDADEDHWQKTIEINLTAPWRLVRALLPRLKRKGAVVVNIGSDSALLGYAGSIAYCASKGALVGLTRALATELAPEVRVLCVCPGPIDTDMMRTSVSAHPDPAAARRRWQSLTLLKRFATTDEIAEAILFAASPSCSFQTGSIIVVDGGATTGRMI